MALTSCPECGAPVSEKAFACPHCGHPMREDEHPVAQPRQWRGFEWRSKAEILGWPLIHIAAGRDKRTGKLLVAKGVIAIGQFGIGLITIAQFGIGFLFAFGQITGSLLAVGQVAIGVYFGLGQVASGVTAIGQFAVGEYVLAQVGLGKHVWSPVAKDPAAVEHFQALWESVKSLIAW